MEAQVMLVLSRKQSERIRLGKDIVVTVVRVAGDKVRLGIEAPADMIVLRDELQTHLAAEQVESLRQNMAVMLAPESNSVSG
jgi:carbon storage regulator